MHVGFRLSFSWPGIAVGRNAGRRWPKHERVRATLTEAGNVLGMDLWQLVSEGPEEELNRTELTQPAILAASVAVWRLWNDLGGPRPAKLAGHSLGEYSALVAAGSMDFDKALPWWPSVAARCRPLYLPGRAPWRPFSAWTTKSSRRSAAKWPRVRWSGRRITTPRADRHRRRCRSC
jgi:hypothetical protein